MPRMGDPDPNTLNATEPEPAPQEQAPESEGFEVTPQPATEGAAVTPRRRRGRPPKVKVTDAPEKPSAEAWTDAMAALPMQPPPKPSLTAFGNELARLAYERAVHYGFDWRAAENALNFSRRVMRQNWARWSRGE